MERYLIKKLSLTSKLIFRSLFMFSIALGVLPTSSIGMPLRSGEHIKNTRKVNISNSVLMNTPTAKSIMVSGQVVSAENSTPLIGVSVLIKGSDVGTTTDSEGNY